MKREAKMKTKLSKRDMTFQMKLHFKTKKEHIYILEVAYVNDENIEKINEKDITIMQPYGSYR